MSIVGIVLGVYISHQYDKVKASGKTAEDAANRANELKQWIEQEPERIYRVIKRSETEDMLNKLIEIPENIKNVENHLLTSTLVYSDFLKLKIAYLSIRLHNKSPRHSEFYQEYLYVFFRHFPYESTIDQDLKQDFFSHMHQSIIKGFASDAIRAIPKITKGIIANGIEAWQVMRLVNVIEKVYSYLPEVNSLILDQFENQQDLLNFFKVFDSDFHPSTLKLKKSLVDDALKLKLAEGQIYIQLATLSSKLQLDIEKWTPQ